jgi:general secretion pathway protein G
MRSGDGSSANNRAIARASEPASEPRPLGSGRSACLARGAKRKLGGFTFVELMVVLTIMVVLISMAIPIYNKTILRSQEAVLHQNLNTLRTVIDNYTYDKMKAPGSLQDLVTEGYLRDIPYDPMTRSNQTWRTVQEDPGQSVDQNNPGIWDVKSGSDKISLEGAAYSDW